MSQKQRLTTFVCVAVVVLFGAYAYAQSPGGDSPWYKRAITLKRFISSSGDTSLQKFLNEWVANETRSKYSDDQLLSMLRQVRNDFSKASLNDGLQTGAFTAELLFGSQRIGGRTSLAFELEEQPPHHFVDFGYVLAHVGAIGKSVVGFPEELREYLENLEAQAKFSGTVLVAKSGETIFKGAYGLASKRYDVPIRIDTKLNLASMSKMFTGVAICQLAEQGRLSFDDKVIKHLPDYPNRKVAEKVTVHQLLTHTSGLGSYWNEKYDATWTTIRTLQQLLPTFVDDPLKFKPGARFDYSNCGPVVLGLIIERISGKTYYDYVSDHIYKPTGMIHSGCFAMDMPTTNLAIGYTTKNAQGLHVGDPLHNNLFSHSAKGGPAGGSYSTVEDLLRFSIALQDHKLLGPKMTETLLSGKISTGPDSKYSYLFGENTHDGHQYLGHDGGAPGISADFRFYPDLGYTCVVLSNYDGAAARVVNFIQNVIGRLPAGKGS